jgi:glutathione S-transferase
VRGVKAKLYGLEPSHPTHAVRLMLEHKDIDHKVVNILPGMHAVAVRALGFRGGTVPALRIDGRRLQGSRQISRALDEIKPEPRLFPADPELRIKVEEAEKWGDEILQNVPRRVTRHLAATRPEMRTHMAGEAGVPAPRLVGAMNVPVARYFANRIGADEEKSRATLALLPALMDHVDSLLDDGTIGGSERNAADFQIAPTVRCLLTFEDLAPMIGERPAAEFARELVPDYPTSIPAGFIPQEWLAPVRAEAEPVRG